MSPVETIILPGQYKENTLTVHHMVDINYRPDNIMLNIGCNYIVWTIQRKHIDSATYIWLT